MSPEGPLGVLRSCQDRVLEREGIPMVLALVSEVDAMPEVDAASHEGTRLAESMDHFHDALVPTSRDTDMGCLISVMQAVSYDDFGRDA